MNKLRNQLMLIAGVGAVAVLIFFLRFQSLSQENASNSNIDSNVHSAASVYRNSQSDFASAKVRVKQNVETNELPAAFPPELSSSSQDATHSSESKPTDAELEKATQYKVQQLAKHRLKRTRNGNISISQQADALAKRLGVSKAAIQQSGHVIVSLTAPMPFDIYQKQGLKGFEQQFDNNSKVTVYAELDNGYPVSMTGEVDFDFMKSLSSMLQEIQTQFSDVSDTSDSAGEWRSELSDYAAAAVHDLPLRSVVLGFSAPYRNYSEQEANLRKRFDIKAAEVVMSEYTPPIGINGRVDDTLISQYRSSYAQTER